MDKEEDQVHLNPWILLKGRCFSTQQYQPWWATLENETKSYSYIRSVSCPGKGYLCFVEKILHFTAPV